MVGALFIKIKLGSHRPTTGEHLVQYSTLVKWDSQPSEKRSLQRLYHHIIYENMLSKKKKRKKETTSRSEIHRL